MQIKHVRYNRCDSGQRNNKREGEGDECSIIRYIQCPFPHSVAFGKLMGTGEFHASKSSHNKSNVTIISPIIGALQKSIHAHSLLLLRGKL